MGNTGSSSEGRAGRELEVETFDTVTNSGTAFKISLREAPAAPSSRRQDEGGLADVWVHVFVEDTKVPVHWDSFVYRAAHVGGVPYSVLFELGGSRYLHFGGEEGVLYIERSPGEDLAGYGVVERNSSAGDPFLIFSRETRGNTVSEVYLVNQRASVSGATWQRVQAEVGARDDVKVASELIDMANHEEIPVQPLTGSRRGVLLVQSAMHDRKDEPESLAEALEMVATEKARVSSEMRKTRRRS